LDDDSQVDLEAGNIGQLEDTAVGARQQEATTDRNGHSSRLGHRAAGVAEDGLLYLFIPRYG